MIICIQHIAIFHSQSIKCIKNLFENFNKKFQIRNCIQKKYLYFFIGISRLGKDTVILLICFHKQNQVIKMIESLVMYID